MRPASCLVLACILAHPRAQAADAILGARVFIACQACHPRQQGGPSLIGPSLADIVGRRAASLPDYPYSPALKASGITWTPDRLDAWLTNPQALVPQTRMAFLGIASPGLRAAVIAYLATLHGP